MKIELLIDGTGFWSRLREDLAAARRQILVQTLSFEGDEAGLRLARALQESGAGDRRVVIDEFTRHVVNDKMIHHPKHLLDRALAAEVRRTRQMVGELLSSGVGVRFRNPVGWFYAQLPIRNHKKLVAVDGRVAYVGGINFSDHNFSWHDLMLRIEDEALCRFLIEDYEWTWRGVDQATARRFGGLELHILGGRRNERQLSLLLDLLDRAERRIFVESPYLGPPFSEALRRASLRGVEVVVVTPERNNWSLLKDHISWKAATSSIALHLYPGRMTHMKAMAIDDRWLVLGSSNFELWSYRFQQEYLMLVKDEALSEEFRAKVERPDLACAPRVRPAMGALAGRLVDLRLEWIERITLGANGRDWTPKDD